MAEDITFVVPVKSQSKRLERKNWREVLGKPLFVYSLEMIARSKHCHSKEQAYVFTDSEEVAKVVDTWGYAKVWYPLEKVAHQDGITSLAHYVRWVNSLGIICIVYANCPARDPRTIDRAIDLVLSGCNSVRSYNSAGKETGNVWAFDSDKRWDEYTGAVIDDALEVHTQEDLDKVTDELREREIAQIGRETGRPEMPIQ